MFGILLLDDPYALSGTLFTKHWKRETTDNNNYDDERRYGSWSMPAPLPLLIIYLFYAIPVDQGTHRLYIEKDSSTKKQGNNRFADEKTVFC